LHCSGRKLLRVAGFLLLLAAEESFLTAAEDGISLAARPGPGAGAATLEWTGSIPTFAVFRSASPAAIHDPANKLGETIERAFVDSAVPALRTVFYYHVIGDLDRDPPIIAATVSPLPNANGWNNTNVAVSFECSDARSGIASCPVPATISAEGVNQIVSGSAVDGAGNASSITVSVDIDFTPPMAAITAPSQPIVYADPTPEVRAAYADPLSGLDSSSVRLSIDAVVLAGCQIGVAEAVCEPPPLAPGFRTAQVALSDRAGNFASATRTFELSAAVQPLSIEIVEPIAGLVTREAVLRVSGTVASNAESVEVNGIPAVLSGGTFLLNDLPLREGRNTLTAVARDSTGAIGTSSIAVTRDSTPPTLVIESPVAGAVLSVAATDIVGMVHDAVTGTVNLENCHVEVASRAGSATAQVRNRSFLVPAFGLVPGPNEITVVAIDAAGNSSASLALSLTRQELVGQHIEMVNGNGQSVAIGAVLPQPLVTKLVDTAGSPVVGRNVTFRVARGDGVLISPAGEGRELTVATDASGRAQLSFRIGTRTGAGNQRVTASATGFVGEAAFYATALNGSPSQVKPMSGESQTAAVGRPLPLPFVVFVHDAGGNPVADVPVIFEVLEGGGHISGAQQHLAVTDGDGLASAVVTLGPEPGVNNNRIQARFAGMSGLPVLLVASGLLEGLAENTRVSGVVLDNTDLPVANVAVRIEGTPLATATDDQGRFNLQGAPVGHIHLIVDGRTTTRPGTWPILAFELTTISGQNNTVGMPIYLLPLDTELARLVGGAEDVTLTMADVPGFEVTVRANSVTCPGGASQCMVGITQVHRDKVPMPPPRGAAPRLVLTVQPPGIHFEPPARVAYPNIQGLPPGHVSDFYSFDHDLGQFVSVGTASVSVDGALVVSDPGSGIREGGWHFPEAQGAGGTGGGSNDSDGDQSPNQHDFDRDGDGTPNHQDSTPDDPSVSRDTDNDGADDSKDPDIDGDGLPNPADSDDDGDGNPDDFERRVVNLLGRASARKNPELSMMIDTALSVKGGGANGDLFNFDPNFLEGGGTSGLPPNVRIRVGSGGVNQEDRDLEGTLVHEMTHSVQRYLVSVGGDADNDFLPDTLLPQWVNTEFSQIVDPDGGLFPTDNGLEVREEHAQYIEVTFTNSPTGEAEPKRSTP